MKKFMQMNLIILCLSFLFWYRVSVTQGVISDRLDLLSGMYRIYMVSLWIWLIFIILTMHLVNVHLYYQIISRDPFILQHILPNKAENRTSNWDSGFINYTLDCMFMYVCTCFNKLLHFLPIFQNITKWRLTWDFCTVYSCHGGLAPLWW